MMRGGNEKHHFELMLLRNDNSVFHAQLNCLFMASESDSPRIRLTLTDITESKCAEEKQRIASVAFQSQECMVITDANKIILQVNRAFIENSGYAEDEVVGRNISISQIRAS